MAERSRRGQEVQQQRDITVWEMRTVDNQEARMLNDAGIETESDVRNSDLETLVNIGIPEGEARKMLEVAGASPSPSGDERQREPQQQAPQQEPSNQPRQQPEPRREPQRPRVSLNLSPGEKQMIERAGYTSVDDLQRAGSVRRLVDQGMRRERAIEILVEIGVPEQRIQSTDVEPAEAVIKNDPTNGGFLEAPIPDVQRKVEEEEVKRREKEQSDPFSKISSFEDRMGF